MADQEQDDNIVDDEFDGVVGLTENELASLTDDESDDSDDGDQESSIHDDQTTSDNIETAATQAAEPIQFIPEYKANALGDIDAVKQDLEASYAQLSDKLDSDYENGELSFVDYRKQTRDLDARYFAEKEKISSAILKSEIASEQARQVAEQRWAWEQDVFFKDNPDFKTDPILFGALNSTLQLAYTDEASKGKSGLQMIREAAAKVTARFDSRPIQNNQQSIPDKKVAQKAVNLPKTLSNVPSAESSQESGGEFDYIDKLSGLAYEKAIARLSPEAQERFMNS